MVDWGASEGVLEASGVDMEISTAAAGIQVNILDKVNWLWNSVMENVQ